MPLSLHLFADPNPLLCIAIEGIEISLRIVRCDISRKEEMRMMLVTDVLEGKYIVQRL